MHMYVCMYVIVYSLPFILRLFSPPGATPRGGMAGVAMTPSGTPFRDKLNINPEDQVMFDDENMTTKRQQVIIYIVNIVVIVVYFC